MGNNCTGPEALYKAVKANNLNECKKLSSRLQHSSETSEAKVEYLEWTDAEGKTPLLLAASKNHFAIAELLLEQDANVHHLSLGRSCAGSALHEAVARQHGEMVDLLMKHGAVPYAENSSRETAMDLAIKHDNVSMLRHLERAALFAGYIGVEVKTALSHKAQDQWAVVMPRHCQPGSVPCALSSGHSCSQRFMLWLFPSHTHTQPLCVLWLNGARVLRSRDGLTGSLRLHKTHLRPAKVYTRKEGGSWTLLLKPADCNGIKNSGRAGFSAFLDVCDQPQAYMTARGSGPRSRSGSGRASAGSGVGLAGLAPASLVAAAGESDEDFARRLSSYLESESSSSSSRAASGPSCGSLAGGRGFNSSSRGGGGGASDPSFGSSAGGRAASGSSCGGAASGASFGSPASGQAAKSCSSGVKPGVMGSAGGTKQPSTTQGRDWCKDISAAASACHAGGSGSGAKGCGTTPPATPPPARPAHAQPSPAAAAAANSGGECGGTVECIVCFDAPPDAALLHGSTAHKCVCRGCAARLLELRKPCPVCREAIDRVVSVY